MPTCPAECAADPAYATSRLCRSASFCSSTFPVTPSCVNTMSRRISAVHPGAHPTPYPFHLAAPAFMRQIISNASDCCLHPSVVLKLAKQAGRQDHPEHWMWVAGWPAVAAPKRPPHSLHRLDGAAPAPNERRSAATCPAPAASCCYCGSESTKFFTMRMPWSVMIDSGWNCTPCTSGKSRCRTPIIVPSSHHAVTSSSGGQLARSMTSE